MQKNTLKTFLLSNAAFATLTGANLLIFSHEVAVLIGTGAPVLYQIIGVGLLGFAGFVLWTAIKTPIRAFSSLLISAADILWVIVTLLLIALAFGTLQPAGIVSLLIVAGIVLSFALGQIYGIQRIFAVPNKARTHRLCVSVDTPEPAHKMWPIIADLPTIKTYSPNLTSVILRHDAEPSVDAVRQCTDSKGKTWGEHCTLFDHDSRKVEFTFLADEPDFPYPFKTMLGGWEVVPKSDGSTGSTVHIWFEVTPKYGLAHPLILAVMSRDLAKSFSSVVARMAAAARGDKIPAKPVPAQEGIRGTLSPCV